MFGACSIDYYFSPYQKRLMSPKNSTRKVNTILKCQEINDIVRSSYGPIGRGDKCLALFTPFLPICDIFLHSPLCASSSFILYRPFFFSSSLPLSLPRSTPLTVVSRCRGPILNAACKTLQLYAVTQHRRWAVLCTQCVCQ